MKYVHEKHGVNILSCICAIDRAALGETRIARGCKLDNLVHVLETAPADVECFTFLPAPTPLTMFA